MIKVTHFLIQIGNVKKELYVSLILSRKGMENRCTTNYQKSSYFVLSLGLVPNVEY